MAAVSWASDSSPNSRLSSASRAVQFIVPSKKRPHLQEMSRKSLQEWLATRADGFHTRELSEEDKKVWKENEEEFCERYHMQFEIIGDFITVWLTSPVHNAVANAVNKCWLVGNSHLSKQFKAKFSLIPYTHGPKNSGSRKTADVQFLEDGVTYPRVVFEVGLSESRNELLNDVQKWFRMTSGVCKVVVLVKIQETVSAVTKKMDAGEEDEEHQGEVKEEDIHGIDFGPFWFRNEIILGICTVDIEVWNYIDDFRKRLKQAKHKPLGFGADQHLRLVPEDVSGPSSLAFNLEDVPEVGSTELRSYELDLNVCRQAIAEHLKPTASMRVFRRYGDSPESDEYELSTDEDRPKRRKREVSHPV